MMLPIELRIISFDSESEYLINAIFCSYFTVTIVMNKFQQYNVCTYICKTAKNIF